MKIEKHRLFPIIESLWESRFGDAVHKHDERERKKRIEEEKKEEIKWY